MAKSSFWDDLGNALTRKAKGLSSKAENLYEIQKIRNKLSAQERMTEKLMMDIGKMIYTRYEHGEAVDGEVGAICEEISQHMLEADHFRDAIAASKGEKFCPACHKAVMREASFCPYCGAGRKSHRRNRAGRGRAERCSGGRSYGSRGSNRNCEN